MPTELVTIVSGTGSVVRPLYVTVMVASPGGVVDGTTADTKLCDTNTMSAAVVTPPDWI
jgi:hypothetical protein